MRSKTQVFVIHGGMTFRNQKDYLHYLRTRKISVKRRAHWSDVYLDRQLGNTFEIIRPRMPLKEHAKYAEWKTYFERHIPYLKNNVILIGESLGGIFLAKYLSENKFPKKILSVYLVCPPFDDTLPKEDLVGGFKLKSDLSLLEKNSKRLTLLFSKDDDIVVVSHAKKYADKLRKARIIIYESKNGHFRVPAFPELVKMIKKDVKRS
jgi:predicted alpha/beta hydrolase family esterase